MAAAVGLLVCYPGYARAQAGHLMISEIGYDAPTESLTNSSEFIEIYNPTANPIVLGSAERSFFLSDIWSSYFLLVDDPDELVGDLGQNNVFCYEFPHGTVIPAGGVVVVTGNTNTFLADRGFESLQVFIDQAGNPQLFEAAAMIRHHRTDIATLSLSNSSTQLVALFSWERSADIAVDHDLVGYASSVFTWPPLSRSAAAGSYQPDANTGVLASPAVDPGLDDNLSITRITIVETGEVSTGGNGLGGHDETTENLAGSFTTKEVSPGLVDYGPASVDLIDFFAERTGNGVALFWRTGSELDCGAFTLLRCDRSAGPCSGAASHTELPGIHVPCADDPAGAAYRAFDDTADPATPYSYFLREHETTGGVRHYGPVRVDVLDNDVGDDGNGGVGGAGMEAADRAGGCAIHADRDGSAGALIVLFVLGALQARRRTQRVAAPSFSSRSRR